jgi:hypothetical protein
MDLGPLVRMGSLLGRPSMPEVQGYRVGLPEEQGFRFENIGAGRYTLVALLPGGYFLTPLTVGAEEQSFPVEVPSQLLPIPAK